MSLKWFSACHNMYTKIHTITEACAHPCCHSNRGVLEIWKVMLDRTEAMAKSLSTAADLLTTKVAESLKQQKKFKEQSYKKV